MSLRVRYLIEHIQEIREERELHQAALDAAKVKEIVLWQKLLKEAHIVKAGDEFRVDDIVVPEPPAELEADIKEA